MSQKCVRNAPKLHQKGYENEQKYTQKHQNNTGNEPKMRQKCTKI